MWWEGEGREDEAGGAGERRVQEQTRHQGAPLPHHWSQTPAPGPLPLHWSHYRGRLHLQQQTRCSLSQDVPPRPQTCLQVPQL